MTCCACSRRTSSSTPGGQPRPPPVAATAPAVEDRWAAYLEECERSIGRPLTVRLFGSLSQLMPRLSGGLGWSIADDSPADDDDARPNLTLRRRWCRSCRPNEAGGSTGLNVSYSRRLPVSRLLPSSHLTGPRSADPPVPLFLRSLIARIMIQLLAHGIWDLDDQSWRDTLARLTAYLVPGHDDDSPPEVRRLAASADGRLHGPAPQRRVARRGNACRPARRTHLEMRQAAGCGGRSGPGRRPAHLAGSRPRGGPQPGSELEDTILLAMDDDPASQVIAELGERGWKVEHDGVMYRVSGAFTNPVTAAAGWRPSSASTSTSCSSSLAPPTAGPSSPGAAPIWFSPTCRAMPGGSTASTDPPPRHRDSQVVKDFPASGWSADQYALDRAHR